MGKVIRAYCIIVEVSLSKGKDCAVNAYGNSSGENFASFTNYVFNISTVWCSVV